MADVPPTQKDEELKGQSLESRKYQFIADGTMPVLDFEIKSGKVAHGGTDGQSEHLTLELYHPMSGEVFEAKFGKGRIEVDRDGSVTYFTRTLDHARLSIFLERNLTILIDKSGNVEISSPSKILGVKKKKMESPKRKKAEQAVVKSDSLTFRLE